MGLRTADRPRGTRAPRSGLDLLLADVSAPASPEELVHERQAVTGYTRVRREAPAGRIPPGRPTGRARRGAMTLVKVSAGVAAALVSGTAFAAQTGNLPAGAQQRLHDTFPFVAGTSAGPATAGRPSQPSRATGASAVPTPAVTADPTLVQLCQAWRDAHTGDPDSTALPTADEAALAAAAGSAERITPFCAQLLGGDKNDKPTGTPTTSTTAKPGNAKKTPKAHPTPNH